MKLTAIIEEGENGWLVGQIQEIPAAISQGKTVEEVKANLLDALQVIWEYEREESEKQYSGKNVIKEELVLAE